MNNHRIVLSIDTALSYDDLEKYLLRALRNMTWATLPHPHMRIAIESDAYELEVVDTRGNRNG